MSIIPFGCRRISLFPSFRKAPARSEANRLRYGYGRFFLLLPVLFLTGLTPQALAADAAFSDALNASRTESRAPEIPADAQSVQVRDSLPEKPAEAGAVREAATPHEEPEPGKPDQAVPSDRKKGDIALLKDRKSPPIQGNAPVLPDFKALNMRTDLPDAEVFASYWDAVVLRHDAESVFGAETAPLPGPVRTQWKNIIQQMPGMSLDKQLRIINGFFNDWPSKDDMQNYDQQEYWAAPVEFLENGGDCEDYAIIKYLALRHFGWKADDLWLLLVESRADRRKHAVLMARSGDHLFILDNLSQPRYLLIPAEQYVKTYLPVHALNEQGILVFVKIGEKTPKDSALPEKSAARGKKGNS